MLQLITAARSWHVLVRSGIALLAVAVTTALQWPIEAGIPGDPFLAYFIVVAIVSIFLGRVPGFLAVAGTSIASTLYVEPIYSFSVSKVVDLLTIEAYAVVAAASVEAFCRLMDGALAERMEANSARAQQQHAQARLSEVEFMARSLAESEKRLRATLENAAVGIAHLSPDGGWLRVNEATSRLLGWPADELVTKSFQELTHPQDLAVELREFEKLRAGTINSYSMDKRSVRKNGTLVWIRRTMSCVRKDDGSIDYFVSVIEDISERKRAEELLKRQADLLDQSHDAIFTWKIGGGILYWNRGAERMYGYSREEAIGRVSHHLLRTCALLSVQEVEAQITRYGSWYGEVTHTTRDGHEIAVESRQVRGTYDGEFYVLETNRDITARKRAEQELNKSEERFRSSLLHSPVPIMLFDDRENIVAVSQSWLDETGYAKEELRRLEDWTARAHGESSHDAWEGVRQLISTEGGTQRVEMTVYTKDRRERFWNIVAAPLGTFSDGRHLFIVVGQDTTERRIHEEQIHLLTREAYHRIKNLLGLVQAIARQCAGSGAQEFVGRFTERIEALAANQDLLVQSQWHGALLEDLVRAQLAHFADLIGSRIVMLGPKLRLNASAAQAIGLAIHELATNAGKYGSLSTDAGRVDVGWRADGDFFEMNWVECDGPPVRPPERRGFGSTVIELMVKQAIGGEAHLDYARSGLKWRFTCHAEDALEGTD